MPHPDAVPSTLRSQVWLRTGWFSNEPAILELANGRLSLVTEKGPIFQAPLSQVSASYKWYRFQCGCKLRIDGRTYPIDFMRPNGGRDFSGQVPASTAIGAGTL
ncbi:MAG: hypothetical protein KY444_10000, partial [Gemmatimonadetes bacterium]|nr:hypothetical protein [Gemmatimonadota bacterium]